MVPRTRFLLAGLLGALPIAVAAATRLDAQTEGEPDVVTVCELARNPKAYVHKAVVVLGRVSQRGGARLIGEDGGDGQPAAMADVRFEGAEAPLPPSDFGMSEEDVKRRFLEIGRRTAIHEFPFGSGSYDHWGIVFGRWEVRDFAGADNDRIGALACRGEALIFLWTPL